MNQPRRRGAREVGHEPTIRQVFQPGLQSEQAAHDRLLDWIATLIARAVRDDSRRQRIRNQNAETSTV